LYPGVTPDAGLSMWDARFQITQAVKQGFDEAGISIPFPQRDVHLIANEAA
jgi:small conductance mechanosensitive channel